MPPTCTTAVRGLPCPRGPGPFRESRAGHAMEGSSTLNLEAGKSCTPTLPALRPFLHLPSSASAGTQAEPLCSEVINAIPYRATIGQPAKGISGKPPEVGPSRQHPQVPPAPPAPAGMGSHAPRAGAEAEPNAPATRRPPCPTVTPRSPQSHHPLPTQGCANPAAAFAPGPLRNGRGADVGHRIQGEGSGVWNPGCGIWSMGYGVQNPGCGIQTVGSGVQDAWCRIRGTGSRQQILGCGIQTLRPRVWDLCASGARRSDRDTTGG